MALPIRRTQRSTLCLFIILIALLLFLITIRGGYHSNLHTATNSYVSRLPSSQHEGDSRSAPLPDSSARSLAPKIYRFHNGRITVGRSRYTLDPNELARMSPPDLDTLYENVVQETTANCSTARRFGRKDDGGWDLCLVGPFHPQEPCFSFSFGINNVWEFDDEVAANFKCQVLTFDSSKAQASHMHSDKVIFLKEGLHSAKGMLNSWSVDSYLGFLKRFEAENYIIDILKMDIEASEWASLETAVRDGSLKNVKQLMIETHISQAGTVQEFQRYFSLLKALYDLGFRQWHHNWNTNGNYNSKLNQNQARTCCHELYYVNINFLTGDKPARNPGGTEIVSSLSGIKITKAAGYSLIDTVRGLDLVAMPGANLESTYFSIVEMQHITCPYSHRIGDAGDGGWDVCFSRNFNIKQSKPCIAFSFGINNIWGYDDALAERFRCKVYMFDPSMNVSDYQRKKTSWFFKTGLSSENKVETNGWQMQTLCKLFEENGYGEKTIDILKIDIEHWEWISFEKAIEDGCLKRVKQLLFESHTSELLKQKTDYAHLIRIWRRLFELGFRTWKWHKNPLSAFFKSKSPPHVQRACCYEHYMLNINFAELG